MRIVKEWPVLFSLSRTGKVKQWQVEVVEDDGDYHISSTHGYVDSKLVTELSSALKGKNIGKKNETSPEQQAMLEAQSKFQSKLDKNYQETVPTSIAEFLNIRPMLAHKYMERRHNIVFPCYVQPKLNGVRSLASASEDKVIFTSRGGKNFTVLDHVEKALLYHSDSEYFPLAPLDGELFNPRMTFEDISGAVKKYKDITPDLEYWIYDIGDTTLDFRDRLAILQKMARDIHPRGCLKIVPTRLVNNEAELAIAHKEFSENYEGTMVRNTLGKYLMDYRSTDLQKLKDFEDDEFLIIGGKQGSGSDEGTVIYTCQTPEGRPFDVRPRGTREFRAAAYLNLANDIGKDLTVRYQNLSELNIPIFPVGIAIRDYE